MLKRLLLVPLFLMGFIFSTQAQSALTLDKLVSFRESDYDNISSYLSNKGWIFEKTEADSTLAEFCGPSESITWVYGASASQDDDGLTIANSFLMLHNRENCANTITYQFQSKATYDAIRATIAKYGMKSLGSKSSISDTGTPVIMTTFQGATTQVTTAVLSKRNDSGFLHNFYVVMVDAKPNGE